MRKSRGMSMLQAGERAGVTDSAISHIEQGRMDVSDARIGTLVSAYGYTLREFRDYLGGKPLPILYREECISTIAAS